MNDDPIVDEVRETRRRILEDCGGDLDRLVERLKAAESKDRHRLVTLDDMQAATVREQEHAAADEPSKNERIRAE